ncbi:MAG: hypothetical protein IJY88_02755, partial [Clostridia bacterium]|nr:hypothetical protein [Clostridia bacterium]
CFLILFPTFSNRFALPKNASIFGDPHTARRVLDARALAPRSPLACIIGIKIHAHVADFYCFLILFPTFSNRFALPKNASIFGDPHTARRVLDARALAPRTPLACIIGIKIHAHVADFYCFLILFPTFSIYYLLSIIYYLISLSHIAYLLSKQKERTAFAPFLLFVYTQPGVQPESLLPTS